MVPIERAKPGRVWTALKLKNVVKRRRIGEPTTQRGLSWPSCPLCSGSAFASRELMLTRATATVAAVPERLGF
jgi:hypothetical protein